MVESYLFEKFCQGMKSSISYYSSIITSISLHHIIIILTFVYKRFIESTAGPHGIQDTS